MPMLLLVDSNDRIIKIQRRTEMHTEIIRKSRKCSDFDLFGFDLIFITMYFYDDEFFR